MDWNVCIQVGSQGELWMVLHCQCCECRKSGVMDGGDGTHG